MDEAPVVFRLQLPACDDPPKGLKPSQEPLPLPPSPIATQGPPLLPAVLAIVTMRRHHLDALASQIGLQTVGVIGVVAETKRALRVGFPSLTSCGLALSRVTAPGRPLASTMAMILPPLPFLVLATAGQPPFAGAQERPQTHSLQASQDHP